MLSLTQRLKCGSQSTERGSGTEPRKGVGSVAGEGMVNGLGVLLGRRTNFRHAMAQPSNWLTATELSLDSWRRGSSCSHTQNWWWACQLP